MDDASALFACCKDGRTCRWQACGTLAGCPGLANPYMLPVFHLQDAVERGWFRVAPDGPPNFSTVLASATELAAGMAYLHSKGMVHGDLSSGAAPATRSTAFCGALFAMPCAYTAALGCSNTVEHDLSWQPPAMGSVGCSGH